MPRTSGEWGFDPQTNHIVAVSAFEEWCHGLMDPDEQPLPPNVAFMGYSTVLPLDEHKANIALICAAPKLLDAAKGLLDASSWPEQLAAKAKLREAIEQAESWEKTPKYQPNQGG